MNSPLVIAKDVIMEFSSEDGQNTQVLHGINMELFCGKLSMIVGPSGCGKTTLLSILTSILTPTKGDVLFDGATIFSMSSSEKALFRRKEVGFIFQQHNLIHTLSSAENAAVPLLASGMSMTEAKKDAVRVLQTLGLGDHVNRMPNTLSGGEQQRVAIARALVHQPRFIVCDEPTASLDEANGYRVMEILKEIAKDKNRAVAVVTHDARIFNYADSIIHMNDGRIVNV
jgi:putative ABC transport system ATP-binding protein